MKAFAIVSAPSPDTPFGEELLDAKPVLHALSMDEVEAILAVSKMKSEVFNILYKMGSIPQAQIDRYLAYRESIRVCPITVVGIR